MFPIEFNILNFNIELVSNYEICQAMLHQISFVFYKCLTGTNIKDKWNFTIKGNDIFLSVCELSENRCYVTTFLHTVLSKPASLQVKLSAPLEKCRHGRS